MVAPEPSGWDLALDHTDHAIAASRLAARILSGDACLLQSLATLHDLLTKLGEFDRGDFEGDMAVLSLMLLDVEPYMGPCGTLGENAARWVPTLVAKHRPAALAACQRIVDRYAAPSRKPA